MTYLTDTMADIIQDADIPDDTARALLLAAICVSAPTPTGYSPLVKQMRGEIERLEAHRDKAKERMRKYRQSRAGTQENMGVTRRNTGVTKENTGVTGALQGVTGAYISTDTDTDTSTDTERESTHTPTQGIDSAIDDDRRQAEMHDTTPPVTRAEADARAEQAGIAPNVVEKWWLFQQEQGWVNARGHRMTRDGAFSSLLRWKINEHRFAQADELTAKRIEAAEAIAARDGRNQANTSNFGRVVSPRSKIARFRATVESLGKGAIYLDKFIEKDTEGMNPEDAAALKAGYLAIMDGHPGCKE